MVKKGDRVKVMLWESGFPLGELVEEYRAGEVSSTGTEVIHAGRIKLPGKVVPDMTHAILEPLVDDAACELEKIGREAVRRFGVNRVHIHHCLGKVLPGGDVLLVMVSSTVRDTSFDTCRWVVDAIKEEKIIRLVEKK